MIIGQSKFIRILLSSTLLFVCINVFSQVTQAPSPTLESPYNTVLVHLYYLQPGSYQPAIAGQTFQMTDSLKAQRLAIQLKQVLDGRGLFVHLNLLPQETDYIDSLTERPFYTPFPQELPEVYLEKTDDKWYYSQQTANAIPKLHRDLYPFGTDFVNRSCLLQGPPKHPFKDLKRIFVFFNSF